MSGCLADDMCCPGEGDQCFGDHPVPRGRGPTNRGLRNIHRSRVWKSPIYRYEFYQKFGNHRIIDIDRTCNPLLVKTQWR